MKPFLSVIVACRNEAGFLPACLDSILQGDYPRDRMEILVVDGNSSDGTRTLALEYALREPCVRVLDNPRGSTSVSVNLAIQQSRGERIAWVSAHSTIAVNYLSRSVEYLESSGAANVGGVMRTVTLDRGPFAEPICAALTSRFGVGNARFRTGAPAPVWVDTVFGGCWRREIFTRVGLFNERLERNQDIEFNLRLQRAGGKILLVPGIESCYFARATFQDFLRRNANNGLWVMLSFACAGGLPVRARHLMPLAFVCALLAACSLAVVWPRVGFPMLLMILTPYLALTLAVSLATAWRRRNLALTVLLPVTFLSLHLSYGAGSLWGLLRLLAEWSPARFGPRKRAA